jgi:hypothetical protein
MAQMGRGERTSLAYVRNLTPEELQKKWPKLRPGNHAVKSHATRRYNCVAFGSKDERHWWESGIYGGGIFWPAGIPDTLDGWVEIFSRGGYEITTSRNVEAGFEKIAIYVSPHDGRPEHLAICDGLSWKSKLGRYQDIEHATLDLLEGQQECEYGTVGKILRRSIKTGRQGRKS